MADIVCTNTAWTEHLLNLDAYTGQTIYLAFYQYDSSATYYGFGIDDFLLEEIPATPVVVCTPYSLDFGVVRFNNPTAYQNVTVTNTGGGILNLTAADISILGMDDMMFEYDPVNLPLALAENESGVIPVRYNPTEEWSHNATLIIACHGYEYHVVLSGIAVGPNALFESFEGTAFPPPGWTVHNGGGTQGWQRATTSPRTGIGHAYLRYDSVAHDDWLISPKLAPSGTNWTYSFWGTNNSTNFDERFNVLVSTTDANITSFTAIDLDVSTGASDYMHHTYDLSYYIGQEIFVAIQAISTDQLYLSIDDVSGPDIVVETPSAPVLVSPADAAIMAPRNPVLSWISAAGDIVTGYKVYCDTNNPPTTLVADVTTTSFTFTTALLPETEYYWTVKAYNSAGTSAAATPFSFTTVPGGLAYIGNETTYNTTSAYPAVYGGRYMNACEQYIVTAAEMTAAGALAGNITTIGFNVCSTNGCGSLPNFTIGLRNIADTEFADNHFLHGVLEVRTELAYTPTAGWNEHTLTRPLYWDGVSSILVQTSFDMQEEHTNNASTYHTSTSPAYRAMYYCDDDSNWNTATTGTRSYNRPNMKLLLEAPAVAVQAAPILTYPADAAGGLPQAGFELVWEADILNGGIPDRYGVWMNDNPDPDEVYNGYYWETTNTYFNPVTEGGISLVYSQCYHWTVVALQGDTEAQGEVRFFSIQADPTVSTCPWTEDFDSVAEGEMPVGWAVIASHTGDDYRGWAASSYYMPSSEPNVALADYHTSYPKDEWMITPPISMEAGQSYAIEFKVRAPGYGGLYEALAVHWGTAPTVDAMTANPALYDDNQIAHSSWTQKSLSFTAPSTGLYYFGWHAKSQADVWYLIVDDIHIFEVFATDLAATGIDGSLLGKVGSTIEHQVSVKNLGCEAQSNYTIYIKEQGSGTVLGQRLIADITNPFQSKVYTVSWVPNTTGPKSVYAEVVLVGDQDASNNVTPAISVTVYPSNTELLSVGANEGLYEVNYCPLDVYFKASVVETIYLASEIQATAGQIQGLIYYNHFRTARTVPAQIWMKNTDATNLSAGWSAWNGYTLVFDGTIECPTGVNEIFIPISPFTYTGENLSIRTSKTFEDTWNSSNYWVVTQDLNYPNRTRYFRSDTAGAVVYDNPATGFVVNNVPNITFIMAPATLVASLAAPAVDMTLSGTDAVLNWALIPYAYNYKVYASENPFGFGDEPVATVYTNNATVAATAGKCFYKVTANTYRDFRKAPVVIRNLEPRHLRVIDDDLSNSPTLNRAQRFILDDK